MTCSSRNLAALFIIYALFAGPAHAANDSLYFLYQRTVYLENLWTPGGWWANPALTGEIDAPSAYTINATPLGYRYTLASVKYLFPFLGRFGAGFGLMGTGISPAEPQSGQASNSGVSYSSQFSFTNPSFQASLGGNLPKLGSAGILIDVGAEMLPDGYGGSSDFLVARGGLGILTPFFFNCASISATAMATFTFWQQMYIDGNSKIGLRLKFFDDLLRWSAEYSLTVKSGESFYTSSGFNYEVFKTMISVKIYKIFGVLAGYSTDFGQFSDIGNCIHLGVELRPMMDNPLFAGYDLGISTTYPGLLIHRLWIGYRFLPKKQDAPQ